MDLEKLFDLLLKNPNNIRLEYSNINGKETLKLNGEEITETYDDTNLKNKIKTLYANFDLLDNCTFEQIITAINEYGKEPLPSLKAVNDFMEQKEFTKEDEVKFSEIYKALQPIIKDTIQKRIDELTYAYRKF